MSVSATHRRGATYAYTAGEARPEELRQPRGRRFFGLQIIECYVLFDILMQLALLVPWLVAVRSMVKILTFGASIFMVGLTGARGRRHPATVGATAVMAILVVSLLNPWRNSLLSAVAQVALYFAILAPLFCMPGLKVDARTMYRVLFIFWIFQCLGSVLGVLQVSFPGRFQPDLGPALAGMDKGHLDSFKIITNSGQMVFRPMGISDMPGGAAGSGMCAATIGILLLVREKKGWMRALLAFGMASGWTPHATRAAALSASSRDRDRMPVMGAADQRSCGYRSSSVRQFRTRTSAAALQDR